MPDIKLRPGFPENAEKLVLLNRKYLKTNIPQSQLQNGFLGFLYTAGEFRKIISRNEIAVASDGYKIIGYYLVNSNCNHDDHNIQLTIIKQLSAMGKFKQSDKIAIGSQAIVEIDYLGKGLSKKLIKFLSASLAMHYDYLFGCVFKTNVKAYKVHTKED